MNELRIGKKVNMLTVLQEDASSPKGAGKEASSPKGAGKEARYICKCDCGNITSKRKSRLINGYAYSCGCRNRLKNDFTDKRFGKLIAMKPLGLSPHREMTWQCKCDCGNETRVSAYSLKTGNTKSCGCLRFGEREGTLKQLPHSDRLMSCYSNMKTRCYNPNYHLFDSYGGKGIGVCNEWINSFKAFYDWAVSNGYSDNLSLDRIDNAKGYSPSNCRWVDMVAQQNNRTNNRILTINGVSDTMANWARITNIPYHLVQQRLYRGRTDKEAVYGS